MFFFFFFFTVKEQCPAWHLRSSTTSRILLFSPAAFERRSESLFGELVANFFLFLFNRNCSKKLNNMRTRFQLFLRLHCEFSGSCTPRDDTIDGPECHRPRFLFQTIANTKKDDRIEINLTDFQKTLYPLFFETYDSLTTFIEIFKG